MGNRGRDVPPQPDNFLHELDRVTDLLHRSLDDLYEPLGDLARAHLRDCRPHLRAALVLATAMRDGSDDTLPSRRIQLAAALEMLTVALSIHTLLITTRAADQNPNRSVVGSTILAGDFCFSRAAQLAAHTESPAVVDTFSQALKTISEGRLRTLVLDDGSAPGDDEFLLEAGVEASAQLADLSEAAASHAHEVVQWLVHAGDRPVPDHSHALDSGQIARWHAALDWLDGVRVG